MGVCVNCILGRLCASITSIYSGKLWVGWGSLCASISTTTTWVRLWVIFSIIRGINNYSSWRLGGSYYSLTVTRRRTRRCASDWGK